jgi:hypothetical protein
VRWIAKPSVVLSRSTVIFTSRGGEFPCRSFELIRRPEDRSQEEQARLDCLRPGDEALRLGLDLAAAFEALMQKQHITSGI